MTFVVYFLLTSAFAIEESGADTVASFNLTHHIVGYLSILLSVSAYVAAMSEEVIHLRKSKPMLLGSALVWFAICIVYTVHGQGKIAAAVFESNLLVYVELLLFILVSMTYLNTMQERGIFDGLRIWLLNKQLSYQQLFWITGFMAFLFSTVISGLTVSLLMGAIVSAVGKNKPQFIGMNLPGFHGHPTSDFFVFIVFKRNGAEITQFRMKQFAIVIYFDIFEHLVLSLEAGYKAFTMNGLDLEAVVPAFHGGVVETVAFFAHAANQLVFVKQLLVNG